MLMQILIMVQEKVLQFIGSLVINFHPFYTKVINTNARDAVHVIDGLLHHETDLNIEEHYTDTAGYTDQVFGLTHILGFRFAPRLRDLADTKLFTVNGIHEYPDVQALLRGKK
ncbi:hypothetical protein GCM10020331_093220 [Ectobacillus funiculus]